MTARTRFFRAAGYMFSWEDDASKPEVALEMHREDAARRRRFFVARVRCAPDRASVRARALAMIAWVRSLDVPRRRDPQAQAVLEQLAILNDRLGRIRTSAPAVHVAIDQMLDGRMAAA